MAKTGVVTIWLNEGEKAYLRSLPKPQNDARVTSGFTYQIRKMIQAEMLRGQAREVIEKVEETMKRYE